MFDWRGNTLISTMEVRLIVWLLLIVAKCAFCEQKFAIEPQDQTAIVGSRVTLPCRVVGKVGRLQWTKDDFGLGEHRQLQGYDRYRMIGSDDEGDYSLEIYPVILEDDAQFQCQVGPGPAGEPAARSRFAQLTVYTPPEPPKIVQGERLLTTEDREIELECLSLGGKPAAEITWIDGLGNVIKDNIEYLPEPLPDGRRFNARSILKLTPKKEHHNTTFTCQAQNQAERTYRSAKLTLEVKYAPKVTVSIVGGSTRLVEGVDVRLQCTADANPANVTYRWYINDRLVDTDATTELHLVNVTRAQHDSIVKCEVQNIVGKSEESETLYISYGPRFRKKPESISADEGSTVTLTCDVDGNPQPDIVWLHEATDRVVGASANLSLIVSPELSGRYYCKANVADFPEIGAEATVYMKGPPSIISHRTQFGIPGDNVRVECTAYAVPPAIKVLWNFKGEDITSNSNSDYSVLEDPLSEGIKSTLIIRESKQDQFGVYNCTVVNAYGSAELEITVKPQKNFPILLILTGVLGGIVVIIAITMVIILCQKKVKKPPGFATSDQTDVEKQCKESDRSSNISDIKLELRTGSSVSNVHCELDYGGNGGGGGGGDSETGSESVVTRIGVPLAGPVPLDHRYSNNRFSSGEYPDPVFPPKNNKANNISSTSQNLSEKLSVWRKLFNGRQTQEESGEDTSIMGKRRYDYIMDGLKQYKEFLKNPLVPIIPELNPHSYFDADLMSESDDSDEEDIEAGDLNSCNWMYSQSKQNWKEERQKYFNPHKISRFEERLLNPYWTFGYGDPEVLKRFKFNQFLEPSFNPNG